MPVYNHIHQEQIVAGETTQNILEKPAVQEKVIVQEILQVSMVERIQEQIVSSAPHAFGSFPPSEKCDSHMYNQIQQEQIVAGEMTQHRVENQAVCVVHSAQRRLRSASHHSSFDLSGRDITEHMMSSHRARYSFTTTAECEIVRVVIEILCYMRLITTQSSNRPRERENVTLL